MGRLRNTAFVAALAAPVTVAVGFAWWRRQTIDHVCNLVAVTRVSDGATSPMSCSPPLGDPWAKGLLAAFVLTIALDVALLAAHVRRRRGADCRR